MQIIITLCKQTITKLHYITFPNLKLPVFIITLGSNVAVGGIKTFAHPGRTDAYGCHTCRTNCPNWGLSYGEYHCHRSKGLPQPNYPVRSHFNPNGYGYTLPAPKYKIAPIQTYESNPITRREEPKLNWFQKLLKLLGIHN